MAAESNNIIIDFFDRASVDKNVVVRLLFGGRRVNFYYDLMCSPGSEPTCQDAGFACVEYRLAVFQTVSVEGNLQGKTITMAVQHWAGMCYIFLPALAEMYQALHMVFRQPAIECLLGTLLFLLQNAG